MSSRIISLQSTLDLRTIQGSFKSFYDTGTTPRLYPSPFAAAIVGRKLIKANEECELQLQETRASRSWANHVGENSALRMPQSRPRTYRCGNPRRDTLCSEPFDRLTESHQKHREQSVQSHLCQRDLDKTVYISRRDTTELGAIPVARRNHFQKT